MNMVFKLVLFSICINFAIGILMTAIPDIGADPTKTGGLFYDEDEAVDFIDEMNTSVTPGNTLEDQADAFDRVLDMLNVGFFSRFLDTIKRYIYGFVYLLQSIFGSYLTLELRTVLFGPGEAPIGILYMLVNIGYILGAFKLWTGRDLRT